MWCYIQFQVFDTCIFSFILQDNSTPLYAASFHCNHDVVKTLLAAGANVNIAKSDVSYIFYYITLYYITFLSVYLSSLIIAR